MLRRTAPKIGNGPMIGRTSAIAAAGRRPAVPLPHGSITRSLHRGRGRRSGGYSDPGRCRRFRDFWTARADRTGQRPVPVLRHLNVPPNTVNYSWPTELLPNHFFRSAVISLRRKQPVWHLTHALRDDGFVKRKQLLGC